VDIINSKAESADDDCGLRRKAFLTLKPFLTAAFDFMNLPDGPALPGALMPS